MPNTSIVAGAILIAFGFLAIEFIRRWKRNESLERKSDPPPDTLLGRLEELESREAFLLSVLDSAPGGITAFQSLRDEQGVISDFALVLANKSASDMVGCEPGDMPGKSLRELFPGNLSGEVFARCARVVDSNEGEHFEAFHTHGDLRRWLSISAEPWADGFVATFEEISQRKQCKQELQESIEEIERFNRAVLARENRVLEMKTEVNLLRSRMGLPPQYKVDSGSTIMRPRLEESLSVGADELTKSRRVALSLMEDARKAVAASQQANEAKSAFLAMISHEIRAPLNGVIGFSDLLLAENLPGHQAEIVSTIRSCGKSLLDLMSDILDLSKIESGRMDLELVPCSLRECLGEVLASFGPALQSKNLFVALHVGDSVPGELVTDPKQLRQIFSNLIGNAIKFTAEGGVSVCVEATSKPNGRLLLDCKVSDTGIGIPEEDQQRIFEMFGQEGPSVARQFGGTGLGLAISRKLVEAMGGEISVKSAPGKGASFQFTIPAYRAQGIRRIESAEDLPLADMAGLRILAVDDVPTNARLMSGLLNKLGCVTATAADGQQAVQLAEETGFDVIFMDVLMPVCDGLEATEMIRNLEAETPGRKPAYIVALTADAFAENKARCLEAGMDEFLTKPLRMDLIRAAIQRGIKKANLAAQPPPPVGT